jgi:hypothetical protein
MKTLSLALALLSATFVTAADQDTLTSQINELIRLIEAGQPVQAIESAEALRIVLASSPAPSPEWMGDFHLYRFIAYYKGHRFQEAFDLADAKEPHPYRLPPGNQGYVASVRAELAMHLAHPAQEILRWGTLAADKRLEAGDLTSSLLACRNTWDILFLRDSEDLAIPLARRLIEGGKKEKSAARILTGFSLLVSGTRRAGITKPLPEFLTQIQKDLRGLSLNPQEEVQFSQIMARLGPGQVPPSNSALLKKMLAK